jgi:plastocyanin
MEGEDSMRSTRRSALILAALAAFALVASACGGNSGSGQGTVKATEKDFNISLDSDTAKSGKVTFDVTNSGPSTHEFVVFKTDLAPDKLPTKASGEVDESGAGVTHVDEIEDVTNGSTKSLTVTLQPGKYVIICNLPGHYKLGMHTALTVS